MKPDYAQELKKLTAHLIDLQGLKQYTCKCHDHKFLELVESNGSTVFRWDQEDGFIFAGNQLPGSYSHLTHL